MPRLAGPWTRKAKDAAIQVEVHRIYASYFRRSASYRTYLPDHLPQILEMPAYGPAVSRATKEILLGMMGVESFVDDYVSAGIRAAGNNADTREFYLWWGLEEARHAQTLRRCLIASSLYDQRTVDGYLEECRHDQWTFERQTGCGNELVLGIAYAMFQELNTRLNYSALRQTIWREYGSPTGPNGLPVFPAISGALRLIEIDEGAHQAVFMQILRAYLRYRPDITLDALNAVSRNYRMPKVSLPNAHAFGRAMADTGLESARRTVEDVINAGLRKLGLEGRRALRLAVQEMRAKQHTVPSKL